MTTEEKLNNFTESAIAEATEQSESMLDDYQAGIDKIIAEHKKEIEERAEINYNYTLDELIRAKNKSLSDANLIARKKINDRTLEIKTSVFNEVNKKLIEYKKTPGYIDLLIKQINNAITFANNEPITIYIDPSDQNLLSELETSTNATLTISDRDFFGGIRAVIESKNILIDNSFVTKLNEQMDSFKL